jgi:hypothetical protein
MNRALTRTALLVAFGAIPAAPALSRDCGPLKEVASLDIAPVPGVSLMAAPLVIDGRPVRLLLDTGAGASGLTPSAAAKLDLHARDSGNVHLLDAGGHAVHRYYRTDSLTISGLTAHGVPFMQDTSTDDLPQVDGTFGPDLMLRYDVEMDFAARKLTYFSQDHCFGHIVHWPAMDVAQVPITIVSRAGDYPAPMGKADASLFLIVTGGAPILGTDIRVEVMLDGHVFTANIDTGAEVSSINSGAARRYYEIPANEFDASPANETAPPAIANATAHGIESVTVTGMRATHRFHALTFGGVTVNNPLFVLRREPADAGRVGSARRPDITIGMNVLRALHLYFAFKERVLYVSAADTARSIQREQDHE